MAYPNFRKYVEEYNATNSDERFGRLQKKYYFMR